jgi:hypothetical protein
MSVLTRAGHNRRQAFRIVEDVRVKLPRLGGAGDGTSNPYAEADTGMAVRLTDRPLGDNRESTLSTKSDDRCTSSEV